MYVQLIASVLGIATFAGIIKLYRYFSYWTRHGIPSISLFETLKSFAEPLHLFTQRKYSENGPIYGYYFITRSIALNDPEIIREVMTKEFHKFPNHRNIHMGDDRIQLNVFSHPGNNDWKRIRSIISPAFSSGKLRAMTEPMSEIGDNLVKNLEMKINNDETIDMKVFSGAFAMDVLTNCGYGINTDSLNNSNHPLVVNAKKFFGVKITLSRVASVIAPSLAKFLRLNPFDYGAITFFDDLTNQLVAERNKQNQCNDKNYKRDFLQLMVNAMRKESPNESSEENDELPNAKLPNVKEYGTLSDIELTAQGVLFFIAGYDTTGATIAHAVYYLSKNIQCQQKLYEELSTVTKFNSETISELKYLNAVIMETLRMAPPLVRIERECVEDCQLENVFIPKGTTVTFDPYALHHDPNYFEDPDTFKPERFIGETTHHPYAYIPFGGGPRLCLGQRFAMNEMRMFLAKVISKFSLTLAPNEKLEYINGNIILTPKHIRVNATKRN